MFSSSRSTALSFLRLRWLIPVSALVVIAAVGVRIGLPLYQERAMIREIRRLGGGLDTIDRTPEWLRSWIGDTKLSLFNPPEQAHLSDEDLEAGTIHLESLWRLKYLCLVDSGISDDTLRPVGGLQNLKWVFLEETSVTEVGLAHLRNITTLEGIDTDAIGGAGLVQLKRIPTFKMLGLHGRLITDNGLEQMSNWPSLEQLLFVETAVTDAGISKIDALPNLKWLHLDENAVGDVAMEITSHGSNGSPCVVHRLPMPVWL